MARGRSELSLQLIASLVVLQVALGLVLSQLYLSTHNSLYNNGNWSVTKTQLWNGLIGSYAFLFDLQPLAGGSLNLAAWHGYQEVVFNRDIDAVSVEFDAFFFQRASYLTFSFNRARNRYTGIRMGPNWRYPSSFLIVSKEGEFLRKKRLRKLGRLPARRWQKLELRFGEAGFSVLLNGSEVKQYRTPMTRPQRIGFRGGLQRVLVDNIRIVLRDGSELVDTFNRPRNWPVVIAIAIGGLLALSWGSFLVIRRFVSSSDKHVLLFYLMFTGVLLAAGGAFLGLVSYQTGFYPDATEKLKRQEAYWKDASAETLFSDIESKYPKQPDAGTHRMVIVGASQTAGAGARSEEETWVRRAERLLNERSNGTRYECINTAVRGYRLNEMSRDFRQRWVHWNPKTMIINASHNDQSGPERFAESLNELVQRALAAGIQVVMIKEPNTGERPNSPALLRMHDLMATVAADHGLPVIEMHALLERQRDDGFLWWDQVHLTPYGHRLFAENLVDELHRLGVVDTRPAAEGALDADRSPSRGGRDRKAARGARSRAAEEQSS